MKYYAHSHETKPWQTLKDHLHNVSDLCKLNFKEFSEISETAGLLHDLGKYQNDFQNKLKGKNMMVDHSTVGAKYIFDKNPANPVNQAIAYAVAGHHAGLPNGGVITDKENATLIARLKNDLPDICGCEEIIDDIQQPNNLNVKSADQYIMFIRMLYSALVDADFIDTETYMNGKQNRGFNIDFCKLLDKLNNYTANFKQISPINKARADLKKQVLENVDSNANIFEMDMPTGSGKTLTSIKFALERAIKGNKERIIYVIPYTSIIEQNAKVFKDIFGDNIVLEHHFNFDTEKLNQNDKLKYDLSSENWDASIIVTTNVQFFESIYANKSSKLRKLHNIKNSVICFDEAQMIPLKLFKPCMDAISILANCYNTDVILMSATLPGFSKYCKNLKTENLINNKKPYQIFKRCDIENLGKISREKFISDLDLSKSNLIVVNSKKEARVLYEMLNFENKIHLSTFQTPFDRTNIIEKIKTNLKKNIPITVISTSLIEAGVDLDFDFVYRSINGLDSILQSAGRCNREGKKIGCKTYIFETEETENIRDKETLLKMSITRTLLKKYQNINCADAVKEYFDILYKKQEETRNSLDVNAFCKPQLWNYNNKKICFCSIAFLDYAEKFKYIDQNTIDIVIALNDDAIKLINQTNYILTKYIRRKLQKYTISVYKNVFDELVQIGAIQKTEMEICYISNLRYYKPEIGLIYQNTQNYYIK